MSYRRPAADHRTVSDLWFPKETFLFDNDLLCIESFTMVKTFSQHFSFASYFEFRNSCMTKFAVSYLHPPPQTLWL